MTTLILRNVPEHPQAARHPSEYPWSSTSRISIDSAATRDYFRDNLQEYGGNQVVDLSRWYRWLYSKLSDRSSKGASYE